MDRNNPTRSNLLGAELTAIKKRLTTLERKVRDTLKLAVTPTTTMADVAVRIRNKNYATELSTGPLMMLQGGQNVGPTGAGAELLRLVRAHDTGAFAAMSLVAGNATGASVINFGDTDTVDVGRIRYMHQTNEMQFWTNGVRSLYISGVGWLDDGGRRFVRTDTGRASNQVIQHGIVTATTNGSGEVTVTFTTEGGEAFTTAPTVVITRQGAANDLTATLVSRSTTNFVARFYSTTTAGVVTLQASVSVTFNWIAIGPKTDM